MKAITLTQPWAQGIVLGYKRVETRSWRTNYRGPLAIHAAKGITPEARIFAAEERALGRIEPPLPLSAVLCIVTLVDCVRTEMAGVVLAADDPKRWGLEHRYGDYSPGRWAWLFDDDIELLPEPIPARGALGLWEWNR